MLSFCYTGVMLKIMYVFIFVAFVCVGSLFFLSHYASAPTNVGRAGEVPVMCTADARQCSDGSYVGRTGPKCEFVCPEVEASSTANDLIVVSVPQAESVIDSPIVISGQARGPWFFEASFPVVLVDWDGLVVAQAVATASGDWMTTDFVPFTANLEFVSPYVVGQDEFMKKGTLIFKKDNPSGLPENDDSYEVPIRFAP